MTKIVNSYKYSRQFFNNLERSFRNSLPQSNISLKHLWMPQSKDLPKIMIKEIPRYFTSIDLRNVMVLTIARMV